MDNLTKILIAIIAVCLAGIIAVFSMGRTITVKIQSPVAGNNNSVTVQQNETAATVADPTAVAATEVQSTNSTETTNAPATTNSGDSGAVATTSPATTAAVSNGSMTVEQIVNLYNTAANKIKTDATQVTRNYHHLSIPEDTLELPSAIQGIGKTAISTFVKPDDNAQSWTSKDDIKAIVPVGNEDYTSKMTASMVESAECKDNGSTYTVTIKLHDDAITNPEKGQGYAGVFNTTSASTFTGINIPTVTFNEVTINGVDGAIKCTIDKASGHITDITFNNTDILKLNVKVVVSTIDCKMAMVQEDNFTIEY